MAKQVVRYTFPTGILKYLHIVNPDAQFNAANPDYNVTLQYPPAVGKKIIADLEKLMPEFAGKIQAKRDNDDNYLFKAKQRSRIEWTDAQGNRQVKFFKPVIKFEGADYEGKEPWGGSTGAVAVELATSNYNGRNTLAIRLKGVRLETIETGSGGEVSEEDELFRAKLFDGGEAAKAPVIVEDDFDDEIEFN